MAASTRTDPFENQHRLYDAQYKFMGDISNHENGAETNGRALAR
jgi:hypothetical protein